MFLSFPCLFCRSRATPLEFCGGDPGIQTIHPFCHSRESGNPDKKTKIMREYTYYVYILASGKNGTLYIGITNDLMRRLYEHKNSLIKGFTNKYKVNNLVYFEETNDISEAIKREKQLKKWNRQWKIELIEKDNPNWEDLAKEWL